MATTSSGEERRLFARFTFREGPLVITPKWIGILEDLSLGGASFQCVDRGQGCLDGTDFDIVLPFGDIQIKTGQYEVVYSSPRQTASSLGLALIRRYHLRFVDLSSFEMRNMWQLIKQNCVQPWEAPLVAHDSHLPPPGIAPNTTVAYLRQARTAKQYWA